MGMWNLAGAGAWMGNLSREVIPPSLVIVFSLFGLYFPWLIILPNFRDLFEIRLPPSTLVHPRPDNGVALSSYKNNFAATPQV